MVVGSTLPLVDVDDAVQIGEVAVQIHPLCVAAAYEPVLDLSRLSRKTRDGAQTDTTVGTRVINSRAVLGETMFVWLRFDGSPAKPPSRSRPGSWRA